MRFGILNFGASRAADIATNIDNLDAICHINLTFVHIIKHLLNAISPRSYQLLLYSR
jgi:hypothetical protein